MPELLDLSGQRFGRLVAIERAPNHKRQTVWKCHCDCGAEVEVQLGHLRSGRIVSCGCYKAENSKTRATIHGLRHTKLYMVWTSMRQRCKNPKNKEYKYYGGRGISVCEEWNDYAVFNEWAQSHGYREGLSIERVDIDRGYCPENCTWIPLSEQAKNTTRTMNNRKKD